MCERLAIIAGSGELPVRIAKNNPNALFVTLKDVDSTVPEGVDCAEARFERLGALFNILRENQVTKVVFAGKVERPKLNPLRMDVVTMGLFPRIKSVLGKGDDALLRLVADVFEEKGFKVVSAQDVTENIQLNKTHVGREVSKQDQLDTDRGWEILETLAPLDLAQGVVVAGGQCLGIETLQGTDAMLEFAGQTAEHLKQGTKGVFVKRSKRGQDVRMDTPTIGPDTIKAVARAGLGGIVIEAGGVLVLDEAHVEELVIKHDLFLNQRGTET